MPRPIRIDFVSDIACPWCAVGLSSLLAAIGRAGDAAPVDLHFQPFELNPDMPPEGRNRLDYFMDKYGLSREQALARWDTVRERAAEAGFAMRMDETTRSVNTFDAHRLLHWADLEGRQVPLKRALLRAYFSDGEDVSDHAVLARLAGEAGLDRDMAARMLAEGSFAAEVRQREQHYMARGVNSVPTIVFDDRSAIMGAQSADVFERALRQLAAERAAV